jgi:hypothetical protein
MEIKKYINQYIIGCIGSILLILAEFFQWFSDDSLFEIYLATSTILVDSFLFLFPLLSGFICLIASILVIYKIEYKVKSVIISFLGLGFMLIFIFDYMSQVIQYLPDAGIGFYLGFVGFLLIFFNILNMLLTLEKKKEGN